MSVVIETTLGDITVDLFVKERPSTCKNFLKLCKLKYYNFSLFHTVQANFIAQTGDPTGSGTGGESIFGIIHGVEKKYYEAESLPKIKHTKPGLLSMVNCGNNMLGSQFFVTLGSDLQSLDEHCVFAEVTEGQDVLLKLNEAVCDLQHRPYRDIRITHTVILEDPFEDLPGMQIPSASPDISLLPASNGRLGADEEVGEELTGVELEEAKAEQEARARATILEIVGDLPHAEIAPPENVLFVCKLNPVTSDDDLELIFSRFGKINSCEVIRDHITGESLQYAFIEFADKKSCEQAYMKMDNVLIDDRRIHVDFSQSVTKIRWKGKGRGVELVEKPEDNQQKPMIDLRYSSMSMMNRGRDQQQYYRGDRDRDRRGRDDRRRDDGRRRRDDDRRDDRRRDDDRRRRPNDRHDSRRQPEPSSSSRRHRDYIESSSRSHGRGDEHSDSRFHRRHEELMSQESNHHSSRQDSRDRNKDQPIEHKSTRIVDKGPLKSSQDNGDVNKVETVKVVDVSPVKLKTPPPRREEKPKEVEEEIETEMVQNDILSQSMTSDPGSVKHSIETKKKVGKKKIKKKKRGSSTSSISSDSSLSSSSSSSTSSSSSSSSSSRERALKKNGKSKRHKHGTLTKKYYDRKGKLIKVVKKHRKKSTSSSDSSSDFSDTNRKRSKKKHKRKKKKKYSKSKKGGKKSSDEEEDDSEDSGSDGGLSKSSKTSEKFLKKRKLLEKAIKSNTVGEVSLLVEEALSQSPEKKKLKMTPMIPLKKS